MIPLIIKVSAATASTAFSRTVTKTSGLQLKAGSPDTTGKPIILKPIPAGFPSNFILSLLEDDKNNLWITTSKGLVCFNPEKESLINYTTINGILNDQFNFNSAYKDSSGRMYFGSVKGLISFKPEEIRKNEFIPPVYITSFQIFNQELNISEKGSPLKKSITYTDKVTLNYDQSTVNIGFAALNYTAPDMTEYAYKMEGLDKNWTYHQKKPDGLFYPSAHRNLSV